RAVHESVGPLAADLVWDPAAMMDQACEETGLDDFGDDRFTEPLAVLVDELSDPATGLSPMGRVSQHTMLVALLKNRLLVRDELVRQPEILDLRIERPIVIAGLPRTGTTHLHNLMAADPALRSLPYWESLEPVLAPDQRPRPGEPDPRIERCEQALWFVNASAPYFKRMHEMTTHHVHEEIQLLALDFSTMLFESILPLPRYRDWYEATDQTPTYRYLADVLKVLQHLRGGDRWVLKSPQHLAQFGPLMTAFPDATVVVTHRDPVAVTASMATMVAYTARSNIGSPDPVAIGSYWSARVEDLLRACVRDRELLPGSQSTDVRFLEFMADDIATVERIYDLADQPFTAETSQAMTAYMDAHPRGRHGRVVYDLAELGLDEDERRAALAFYADRFLED
ncbi:MAG: sulfotransferase, partial [Actinomycetota bacterium]